MRDNTHAPMEMKHITPDVLMRLSIAFTSGSKFSQSLEKALELIGKISNHDRIYIIEVHHNMTYTITYNWHEKSLKAIPEEFRHNSLIYDRELVQQLCTQNQVIIQESDVSGNPELAELLKVTFIRIGITICFYRFHPMFDDSHLDTGRNQMPARSVLGYRFTIG